MHQFEQHVWNDDTQDTWTVLFDVRLKSIEMIEQCVDVHGVTRVLVVGFCIEPIVGIAILEQRHLPMGEEELAEVMQKIVVSFVMTQNLDA